VDHAQFLAVNIDEVIMPHGTRKRLARALQ
jgi:hypothetical protein